MGLQQNRCHAILPPACNRARSQPNSNGGIPLDGSASSDGRSLGHIVRAAATLRPPGDRARAGATFGDVDVSSG